MPRSARLAANVLALVITCFWYGIHQRDRIVFDKLDVPAERLFYIEPAYPIHQNPPWWHQVFYAFH